MRYANIGLAVGIAIFVTGAVLLRNASNGVLQTLALVSMAISFAVYHGLDERNKRREGRRRKGQ